MTQIHFYIVNSIPLKRPNFSMFNSLLTCNYHNNRMAGMFSGLRIDNCHSTPKHVGQAMMDTARAANPNLIVVCQSIQRCQQSLEYLIAKPK